MTTAPEASDRRGTPDGLTAAWRERHRAQDIAGFPEMIGALRALQDDITAAAPPESLVAEVTRALTDLSARLRPHAVDERGQVTGHLQDLPGRGQAMTPPLHFVEHREDRARAQLTFGRFYLGGNGAVHGGAVPLVFDELLGRLANTGGRPPSRTAYLHVDFRSITPVDAELRIEGWFEREEGRKRFLRGTLHHGGVLCAEAAGLFVALRPGQP